MEYSATDPSEIHNTDFTYHLMDHFVTSTRFDSQKTYITTGYKT